MYGAVPYNNIPELYLCSVNKIYHSLSTLDTSKATGPDKISAHMLKATARSIAPSVTVLIDELVPPNWHCTYRMEEVSYCTNTKIIDSYHP